MEQNRFLKFFSFAAFVCLPFSPASASLIVTSFGPAAFSANTAAMNSALGITGYAIEDFEDTTLINGLSYTLSEPAGGTFNALPNTASTSLNAAFSGNQWDGENVLMNNSNNNFPSEGVRTDRVTFDVSGGTLGFGVGLANFQSVDSPIEQFPITNHELFINGQSYGLLENLFGWVGGRTTRNAYLLITATDQDVINSVSFRNLTTGAAGDHDLLIFDHLAVKANAVPEPVTLGLLSLGSLGALGLRRRVRRP